MHSHTLMAQTECVSEKKRGGRGVRVRTAEVSKCVCERESQSEMTSTPPTSIRVQSEGEVKQLLRY